MTISGLSWFEKRISSTSLVAPGALANHLQRHTARKADEANLDFPNLKKWRSLPYSFMGIPINFR